MSDLIQNRREFFKGGAAGVGAAFLFVACGGSQANSNANSNAANGNQKDEDKGEGNKIEVTAVVPDGQAPDRGGLRRTLDPVCPGWLETSQAGQTGSSLSN